MFDILIDNDIIYLNYIWYLIPKRVFAGIILGCVNWTEMIGLLTKNRTKIVSVNIFTEQYKLTDKSEWLTSNAAQ